MEYFTYLMDILMLWIVFLWFIIEFSLMLYFYSLLQAIKLTEFLWFNFVFLLWNQWFIVILIRDHYVLYILLIVYWYQILDYWFLLIIIIARRMTIYLFYSKLFYWLWFADLWRILCLLYNLYIICRIKIVQNRII